MWRVKAAGNLSRPVFAAVTDDGMARKVAVQGSGPRFAPAGVGGRRKGSRGELSSIRARRLDLVWMDIYIFLCGEGSITTTSIWHQGHVENGPVDFFASWPWRGVRSTVSSPEAVPAWESLRFDAEI